MSAASTTRGSRTCRRARRRADALELPPDGQVVVVSGGGWGVGDLGGAVEEALACPGAFVVLLCGSREEVRAALAARFAGAPRVRVLGFIDRMPELLAAADVLIHSTAGLTVMEALVAACSVISYGWGRGHIRANNRAFALHGMAQVARDRAELRTALRVALAAPAGRDRSFVSLPTAAQSRARALRSLGRRRLDRASTPEHRRGARPTSARPARHAPRGEVHCSPTAAGARRTGIAVWVDEDERADDRGRQPLQAAHLGVEREQRGNRRGGAPAGSSGERAVREVGDGDLRGDHGPRLAESGREHEETRPAGRVRGGEHDQHDPAATDEHGDGMAAAVAPAASPPSATRSTPAAAPTTASRSRRSTRSPRRRSARTTSRPSPSTSAGCTTLSGARERASSCRATPHATSAEPPSHDRRRASRSSSGASAGPAARASPAWTT